MVSILTNRKVRSDIAMTGEITLRGRVLPIGGLKEKLLAALSHGIKEVLIPKGKDVYKRQVIHYVRLQIINYPLAL